MGAHRRDDNGVYVAIPVGLIVLGGGVMVWLAPVPAERITPAQSNLLEIAESNATGGAKVVGVGQSLAMLTAPAARTIAEKPGAYAEPRLRRNDERLKAGSIWNALPLTSLPPGELYLLRRDLRS